ncbi:MAG TPA: SpoIIE family protein phosphatase [Acidimicrobiales bacterium]|nr:SpoIIE family protein phosphatase [Acidimicrobiales bacterium]
MTAETSEAPELLLVEDDEGDALLVQALLEEVGDTRSVAWARSLAQAEEPLRAGPQCVLLDLGLPDSDGNAAVRRVVTLAPDAAVVVLTGLDDEERGIGAMAAGAQDYLVKGTVDGHLLVRSVRYAIERKRAANTAARLREAELRAEENDRLERGLLPRPLLRSNSIRCITLYEPGGEESTLGGDFFDVVELQNGTIRAMIGDVAGHGPDEAALGVRLRVAWRTLVIAGIGTAATLVALEDLFITERPESSLFATICDVQIAADHQSMTVARAGHLPPLLVNPGGVVRVETPGGPPLGVLEPGHWEASRIELGERWSVVLYTDGLVENVVERDGERERIGEEGLAAIVGACVARGDDIADIVDHTLATLHDGQRSALSDDVAIVALSPNLAPV